MLKKTRPPIKIGTFIRLKWVKALTSLLSLKNKQQSVNFVYSMHGYISLLSRCEIHVPCIWDLRSRHA